MVTVFDQVAIALADLMGTTQEIAGFILGAVVVLVFIIILQWLIGDRTGNNASTFLISATLGVIVATLFSWFPVWVIIFLAVMIAFVLIKPFGEGAPPGG